MKVTIADYYENARHHLTGDVNDIRLQLMDLYPWLLGKFGNKADINILIDALNKSQCCTAKIDGSLSKSAERSDGIGLHVITYPDSLGHGQLSTNNILAEACRAAAEFLAGHPCTDQEMRQALLQCEGQPDLAALLAHGLPESDLSSLNAIINASLKKAEPEDRVSFKNISATTDSSKTFAKIIQRANDANEIRHVKLGAGKHTEGTLLAQDPDSHKFYILKPGSGKQNPVEGETESGSTQSQRECCFYAVAQSWGLGDYVPECHLLLIDEKEYACIVFLPKSFKNLNDLKIHDPNLPTRVLSLYRNIVFKWATLDYVLGNPDRHYGNLMMSGDQIKLIDHGSAFAGTAFNPATDKISFVPAYLRPGIIKFRTLSVGDKLRALPRLNNKDEQEFKAWLLALNTEILHTVMSMYGIDSKPEEKRLNDLQHATSYQSADLAIISAWILP